MKSINEKLDGLAHGERLKLPNHTLLELFFTEGCRHDIYKPNPYYQTKIDSTIAKLDLSDFIKLNGHLDNAGVNEILHRGFKSQPLDYTQDELNDYEINMFLGANLENSDVPFDILRDLFLNAKVYSKENLSYAHISKKVDSIPGINLANNNFNGREWDFNSFIKQVIATVRSYVEGFYTEQIRELTELYEDAFNNYGSTSDIDGSYLYDAINEQVRLIVQKLIPNLNNTGLKIKYYPQYLTTDETKIIEDAVAGGKFNGCDIDFSSPRSEQIFSRVKPILNKVS